MPSLISRRLTLASIMVAMPATMAFAAEVRAQVARAAEARLQELERAHGGRLGVAILNASTGAMAEHRAHQRFLLCSTFKTLLAALILARVDRGEEALDRRIHFSRNDVVVWSPVTARAADGAGMTVADLCEATVTLSDNTAANLLLASVGGPAGLTDFVRGLGDGVTRLDRIEPALNEHDGPGDLRDTTTPMAMLRTLHRLFHADVLSPRSRSQLTAWHIANKTGDDRLRAGLPRDWLVGDKTGTNATGTANDIGVAWPLGRGPIIITAYCEMPLASSEARNRVLAEVGRIAATV